MTAAEQPSYPTLIELPVEVFGPRVVLRPFRQAYGAAFVAAVDESRIELERWMTWPGSFRTDADGRDYCARMAADWIRRDQLVFAMFDRITDQLLGGTGLHNVDWDARTFEIGYWLRTSQTRKGLMTETVQLLTMMAFSMLAAQRVAILVDPRNEPSRAIPARIGYVLEGTLRNDSRAADGSQRDTSIYSLIPEDFTQLRQSHPLWLNFPLAQFDPASAPGQAVHR